MAEVNMASIREVVWPTPYDEYRVVEQLTNADGPKLVLEYRSRSGPFAMNKGFWWFVTEIEYDGPEERQRAIDLAMAKHRRTQADYRLGKRTAKELERFK